MTFHLDPLLSHHLGRTILGIYADHGYSARFIGGCVRDCLLNRSIQDIDLATDCPPEQGMALLQQHGFKTIPTGLGHGTITAIKENTKIEITTLRQDITTDGRHAVVTFTTEWAQDASRRDFTINALSVDDTGRVFDYFNGLADLQAHRLRFIGEATARISEDYLRLLRYCRFCAQLGWAFDETLIPLFQSASTYLRQLSRERIQQEMFKLLVTQSVLPALNFMAKTGILHSLVGHEEPVQPRLEAMEALITIEHKTDQVDAFRRIMALCGGRFNELESCCVMTKSYQKRIKALHHPFPSFYHRLFECDTVSVLDWVFLTKQPYSYYQQAIEFEKPLFPLKATDLQDYWPELKDKALGDTLKKALDYWITNQFLPSKAQLIQFLSQ